MNLETILAVDLSRKLQEVCLDLEVTQREVRAPNAVFNHRELLNGISTQALVLRLSEPPFSSEPEQLSAMSLALLVALAENKLVPSRWSPRLWISSNERSRFRLWRELTKAASRNRWDPVASQGLIELMHSIAQGNRRIVLVLDPDIGDRTADFAAWHLRDTGGLVVQLRGVGKLNELDESKPNPHATSNTDIQPSWAMVADKDLEKIKLLDAARNTAAWIELYARFAGQAATATYPEASKATSQISQEEVSLVPWKTFKKTRDSIQRTVPERWLLMDLICAVAPDFYDWLKKEPIGGATELFDWLQRWPSHSPPTSFAASQKLIPNYLTWPAEPHLVKSVFDPGIHSTADASAFLDSYFRRGSRKAFRAVSATSRLPRYQFFEAHQSSGEGSSMLALRSFDELIGRLLNDHTAFARKMTNLPATVDGLFAGLHELRYTCDLMVLHEVERSEIAEIGIDWLLALKQALNSRRKEGSDNDKEIGIHPFAICSLLAAFYENVDASLPSPRTKSGKALDLLRTELKELENVQNEQLTNLLEPGTYEGLSKSMAAVRMLATTSEKRLFGLLLDSLVKTVGARGERIGDLYARLLAILWTLSAEKSDDQSKSVPAGLRMSAWVEQLRLLRASGELTPPFKAPLAFISYRRNEGKSNGAPAASPIIEQLLAKLPPNDETNGGRLLIDREIEQHGVDNWNDVLFRWLWLSDTQVCFVDDRYYDSKWCLLELLTGVVRARMEAPRFKLVIIHRVRRTEVQKSLSPAKEPASNASPNNPSPNNPSPNNPSPNNPSPNNPSPNNEAPKDELPKNEPLKEELPAEWHDLRDALIREVKARTTTHGKVRINDQGRIENVHEVEAVARIIKDCLREAARWRAQFSETQSSAKAD